MNTNHQNILVDEENTLLIEAIKNHQSLSHIQQIIDQDPDSINDKGFLGNTALCLAAKQGKYEIVQLLLDHNADPNIPNNLPNSPLIWALKEPERDVRIIHALLEAGADVNFIGHMNKTPLTWTVIHGRKDLLELMLQHDANPNIPDYEVGTPIFRAAMESQIEILELLLENGAKYYLEPEPGFGNNLLFWGSSMGYENMVDCLIQQNQTAPHEQDKLDLNLQWQGSPEDNDQGNTALMFALKNGFSKIAEILIDAGANPDIVNGKGQSAHDFECPIPRQN